MTGRRGGFYGGTTNICRIYQRAMAGRLERKETDTAPVAAHDSTGKPTDAFLTLSANMLL